MAKVVDKAEKYDRQIRLWGTHGQERIENSSIACLHATAATTETLKNLILPGMPGTQALSIQAIMSFIISHQNIHNN